MRWDAQIYELAERQRACVATWQLRDLGVTSTEIACLRSSSRWQSLSSRVLALAGMPATQEQHALAAVLDAGRAACLGVPSAAAWWQLGSSYRLVPAAVMADHETGWSGGALGRMYPRRNISDRWITAFNGIPVVRPELCIYQLCGLVSPKRAERALDTGLSMGLVTIPSMQLCLKEVRRRGRNGTSVLEELLRVRPIGYVAPASGLEARFRDVVGPGWRRQVDSGGEMWAGRVDFRHEVEPVICEVQSERYHAALSFREDDDARRKRLEAAGFVVVEVWDRQVWHDPESVRSAVRQGILAVPATQKRVAGTAKSVG